MNRLRIFVCDKNNQNPRELMTYQKASAKLRFNEPGEVTIDVGLECPHLSLLTLGGRIVALWDDVQVFSGPIRSRKGTGPSSKAVFSINAVDDYRAVYRILAWPDPAAISKAGVKEYSITASAETAALTCLSANAARGHLPTLQVATSANRGASVTLKSRFEQIGKLIKEPFSDNNLRLVVQQPIGQPMVASVRDTKTVPNKITEESGSLVSWSFTEEGPKATRILLGGKGDFPDREMPVATNTGDELALNDSIEILLSESNVADYSTLLAMANSKVSEYASTLNITATLSESSSLRFVPNNVLGFDVGDKVNVSLPGGITGTVRINEVSIDFDKGKGYNVTANLGDGTARGGEVTTLMAKFNDFMLNTSRR